VQSRFYRFDRFCLHFLLPSHWIDGAKCASTHFYLLIIDDNETNDNETNDNETNDNETKIQCIFFSYTRLHQQHQIVFVF
jgi:hypothetical protein